MKRIGMLGGMSWHSTVEYYQIINEEINRRLGKQHSAELILISLDFESILIPWQLNNWDEAIKPLINAIKQLEKAEADFFLLCSNAIHKFATTLAASTQIPMLHIATAVGKEMQKKGLKKVGLLGTKITMEVEFYQKYLNEQGIVTLIPKKSDQHIIDRLIFDELTKGIFTDQARIEFERLMREMKNNGAMGIILGCTEIPLLFSERQFEIPLFDSLKLHAMAAVDEALSV